MSSTKDGNLNNDKRKNIKNTSPQKELNNNTELELMPQSTETKGLTSKNKYSDNKDNKIEIQVNHNDTYKDEKNELLNKPCSIKLHTDEIRNSKKSSFCNCCKQKDESTIPYEFHINNNILNIPYEYKNNMIMQAKYTIWTFFPKSLLFQFFRLANVYFLVIAILQLISIVSPLSPETAVIPLVSVLLFSMAREGVEDLARHKYDDKLNSEPTMVYNKDNQFEGIESGKLKIGDIVLVKCDQDFPADLLVIDSNILNGVCFIETATLDGEKALKNKIANKATAGLFRNDDNTYKTGLSITGVCACDKPNADLYQFDGQISLLVAGKLGDRRIETGLDAKQLLLKGKY